MPTPPPPGSSTADDANANPFGRRPMGRGRPAGTARARGGRRCGPHGDVGSAIIWARSGAGCVSDLARVLMSAKHAAAELARRTGRRDVAPVDVRELARKGYLRRVAGGSSPLYDGADVERFTAVEELRCVGDARRAWWAASRARGDAAEARGMSLEEFDVFAARRGLGPGRLGRYCRSEIAA